MSKTFKVAGADGPIEAEQLGTFAYYIQNIQFRFVITKLPGMPTADVTHRVSGKRLCAIPFTALQAAVGDYVVAGKGELRNLIDRVGEARVRSVLAAAE
ncbi:hypothetical protein [Ralstonia mannitolilytica]|uniref:hypothetical protein n=1 Tax=Ralstonia mannitolilytica TaxID=105219 RepID=UPI000B027852|nr:hypothetical protein [Ralstonia mannitolilytica]